jgi:cytochrome c-type biogenesis protein CcmH/NrfF
MRGVKIIFTLCCALSTFGAVVAAADERSEKLDREATTLYQQVFSPFCPGRSLNDCPSSKAGELKDEMRAQLESGMPAEVVLQGVIDKYGEQYRAVPRFAGIGIFVWVVPLGFVAIGLLAALLVSLGRKKVAPVVASSRKDSISDEDERRIAEELSKLD